ncbi:Zn-dependent M28 family amino/carboxypeptidase [Sphingomonas sp. BE270]|jgi:Zn-dependent M28 family amino/carboxypeptidase|uniref:M28 family metallopeptidase n=1 Tax=unclassified Sphingomonas TaxID=196159 RepID=UPI00053E82F3|nr:MULTISPECIES: M28 family metallopeptidase [unclassified Sphingomonas]MDR6848391.1 Zn-dependent M28 family amino/carboxypeptidase [Sphingomonas sp. BE137]MDR7259053.1 Zn-dependent M28 family amino/carboxypeptidase [Sphingomonas sp. BE270]
MRAIPTLALTLGLLTAANPVLAQNGPLPTISVETLKDVTKTLSSDAFEGRKPTTAGEAKATDYIVERFKAAGLKPGNDGKWFQDVPLVELTAKNVTPLSFTGGKAPVSLAYRSDVVIATYRVTPRIDIRNSPVVFVGYGITAPERGWDDYAGVDVKGKTVVILVNDPDWQTPTNQGLFEGRAMTYYGRWTYKFEEAARHGAAAAIIVHETAPAAYGWGVVQSSWTGPQLELDEAGDHADQSQAIGWMQLAKARELFASAGQDFDALNAAAKVKGFKAVPLGVTASVSFDNTIKRQASKNVIGILPGTTAPNDYVYYTAHWDHLGHCDAVKGDDICNGALDNASGVAGLVALAEANVKAGPARRTLVFLSVTCEECGLLGSRYYAQHPIYPIAQTVGGVNMDGLNTVGRAKDFVVTGAGKSELEDRMKLLVEAQGRVVKPEPNPERGSYFRSDHFSFAKLGVPMFYGESGEDLRVGGEAAGHAATLDYIEHRYHKPQDEYNPAWDWAGAVEDVQLYYALGRSLADGSDWPNWYKTAEFRAIRDQSRASATAGK